MEKIHKDFTGCKYGTATVNDKQIMFTGKSPRTPVEGKKTPSERKKTPISKYLKDYHIDVSSNTAIQQCPKCPQVFTRKAILDMHIRMSHKSKDTGKSLSEALIFASINPHYAHYLYLKY